MDIPADTQDDWTFLATRETLRPRVTLDDYLIESVRLARKGLIPLSEIESRRSELEKRMQAGDEWWEWVAGSEPLMQMGGIALVRSSAVIWARMDWIS